MISAESRGEGEQIEKQSKVVIRDELSASHFSPSPRKKGTASSPPKKTFDVDTEFSSMFRIRWADGAPDSLVDDVTSVAELRSQVRD